MKLPMSMLSLDPDDAVPLDIQDPGPMFHLHGARVCYKICCKCAQANFEDLDDIVPDHTGYRIWTGKYLGKSLMLEGIRQYVMATFLSVLGPCALSFAQILDAVGYPFG